MYTVEMWNANIFFVYEFLVKIYFILDFCDR